MRAPLFDYRCTRCNRLLFRLRGEVIVEIKCKCGFVNTFETVVTLQ